MYLKDKKNSVNVRFNDSDFSFLVHLSAVRGVSITQCIRSIVNDYKRNFYDYLGGKEHDQ